MGKFLKILGWLLLGLLLGMGLWAYLSWKRLTAVPDWYPRNATTVTVQNAPELSPSSPAPSSGSIEPAAIARSPETLRQEAAQLQQKILNTLGPGAAPTDSPTLELSAAELETLLLDQLLRKPIGADLLQSAQGFAATIDNGTLKSGLVINTDRIPRQLLSPGELESLDRLLATVPGLQGRDLYIGITGQPQVVQGTLQGQDTLQLQIGETQWDLAELTQPLGIDPGKVDQELNKVLGNLPVESLRLEGDRLILQGAPPAP